MESSEIQYSSIESSLILSRNKDTPIHYYIVLFLAHCVLISSHEDTVNIGWGNDLIPHGTKPFYRTNVDLSRKVFCAIHL